MPVNASPRDPRSIVTPDAFEVHDGLLGLPLAPPAKRLWAIIIDLLVIGFVTLVTRSFALVLGVAAAAFFLRAGFKRTPVKGSVFGRAMRLSVDCFGLVIGIVTAIVWAAVGIGGGGDDDSSGATRVISEIGGNQMAAALGGLRAADGFRNASTAEEAEEAAREVVRRSAAIGLPTAEIRDLLESLVPEEAAWTGDARSIVDRALASEQGAGPAEASGPPPGAELSTEEALEAYAALLRSTDTNDTTEESLERRALLQSRLLDEVAADTLQRLAEHLTDLEDVADRRELAIQELSRELEKERAGGFVMGSLRSFVDELGFGFGWASLYLTVFLSWWNGQTVGKRLLGLRVVRLDGEPITWWVAFERAGGYAAGFATGLLGFAQIYWDANRQAIHDRIVGTVVVIDGAEGVGDWHGAM